MDRVSVVIPTFNSASHLRSCLKAVCAQTYPCLEIIVVDNFSADYTLKVAKSFGAKIVLYHGNQAAARNIGVCASQGRYVLFVDSDQCLDAAVVGECVELCSGSGNVGAVKIPEVFAGLTFWGKCSAFWKNHMVNVWGVDGGLPRFYVKEVLEELSGFNDKLRFWEDQELNQRLTSAGVNVAWCKSHIVHFEEGSLGEVTRKYLSYGKSVAVFSEVAAKAPYHSTAKLTCLTMVDVLKCPGRSLKLFCGFSFLFTLKSLCASLGFLVKRFSIASKHK